MWAQQSGPVPAVAVPAASTSMDALQRIAQNATCHAHCTEPSSSRYHPFQDPPVGHVVSSASLVLDQAPPPSLRDILTAYKANGDGDREMLLAMLNAKTAEDQRLASVAALHRSMLEAYQSVPQSVPLLGGHHYPTATKYTPSPPVRETRQPRHYHSVSSVSRSPPSPHTRIPLQGVRAISPKAEHRRKRVRASHSPPPPHVSSGRRGSLHDQPSELPPSPYSSSGSDSAGQSPRSRGSMTIGSLLSSGPDLLSGTSVWEREDAFVDVAALVDSQGSAAQRTHR
ncbi:hypothetical protein GGX14DRAFT_693732 [Mycena pura]|uniref:Uncharacterized protein n=1 Tax=Mycena pura TaxID=153505 RepID=A0AAD7E333_9AGAR|nr:hypothetical protein GGX14DRAFT_693732 [Mycena pura]